MKRKFVMSMPLSSLVAGNSVSGHDPVTYAVMAAASVQRAGRLQRPIAPVGLS